MCKRSNVKEDLNGEQINGMFYKNELRIENKV